MKEIQNPLIESIVNRVLGELINEGSHNMFDEEPSAFEEYEQDYSNDDISFGDINKDKLARWCETHDFLYICEGFRGITVMNANMRDTKHEIVSDIYKCKYIEPTHEVDYLVSNRERLFESSYVCIFKLVGLEEEYYIIYERDKYDPKGVFEGKERKRSINEAFKSSELRNWFKEHGGVKRLYNEYPDLKDKRVFQDGLGDLRDEDILYFEEFDNYNDALNKKRKLIESGKYTGQRSDWDMKAHFTIYSANDGTFLLVGIDRKKVDIGTYWGGDMTKKSADRMWQNGWNYKTGSNRYADDSDTYYYGKNGQYFGLYKNTDFKNRRKHNKDIRNRSSEQEWNDYQNYRRKSISDYLKDREFYNKFDHNN